MGDKERQDIFDYCVKHKINTEFLDDDYNRCTAFGMRIFVFENIIIGIKYKNNHRVIRHIKSNKVINWLLEYYQCLMALLVVLVLLTLIITVINVTTDYLIVRYKDTEVSSEKSEYPDIEINYHEENRSSYELNDVVTINGFSFSIDNMYIDVCSDKMHANLKVDIKIENNSNYDSILIEDTRIYPNNTRICGELEDPEDYSAKSLTVIRGNSKTLTREFALDIDYNYAILTIQIARGAYEPYEIMFNIPVQELLGENN